MKKREVSNAPVSDNDVDAKVESTEVVEGEVAPNISDGFVSIGKLDDIDDTTYKQYIINWPNIKKVCELYAAAFASSMINKRFKTISLDQLDTALTNHIGQLVAKDNHEHIDKAIKNKHVDAVLSANDRVGLEKFIKVKMSQLNLDSMMVDTEARLKKSITSQIEDEVKDRTLSQSQSIKSKLLAELTRYMEDLLSKNMVNQTMTITNELGNVVEGQISDLIDVKTESWIPKVVIPMIDRFIKRDGDNGESESEDNGNQDQIEVKEKAEPVKFIVDGKPKYEGSEVKAVVRDGMLLMGGVQALDFDDVVKQRLGYVIAKLPDIVVKSMNSTHVMSVSLSNNRSDTRCSIDPSGLIYISAKSDWVSFDGVSICLDL